MRVAGLSWLALESTSGRVISALLPVPLFAHQPGAAGAAQPRGARSSQARVGAGPAERDRGTCSCPPLPATPAAPSRSRAGPPAGTWPSTPGGPRRPPQQRAEAAGRARFSLSLAHTLSHSIYFAALEGKEEAGRSRAGEVAVPGRWLSPDEPPRVQKVQVERIVDKRKNKKGKWEYLIRWKGYGSTEDTWEPEHHLLHCEEFIDEFNGLHLTKDKRVKSGKQAGTSKLLRDTRSPASSVEKLSHRPAEPGKSKGASHKRKRINPPLSKPRKGYSGKPPGAGDRAAKTVSYRTTPSGLQIMPMKKAPNGMENGDAGSEKDERHFGNGSHQPDVDLTDPVGEQDASSGECDGPHSALVENGLGSALTNGGLNLHSPVKRKLEAEKDYVFDKRLRYSVRQNESNCRFRDIVVRKEEGFTHILLSSQTSDNNALTPEIMKEVRRALCNAATDDSKLLLLSAVGSVFCSGLDYSYLIGRLSSDRRKESTRIAEAIRDFVKAFIQFKKPIVVAINGPALGLGASILPLCDIVWASEKAWFQTPYATIRLTPAGCSSYTFPQILGVALANEMLFCGRKLTAQEACSRGLVSQVFWPTTFSQEVMLRVKEMASCSAVVLEESKCLVRSFLKSVLEDVNEKECVMLKQLWSSSKGLDSLFSYLQDKIYEV
ncbi:chromodomain Y-like protein 2 [Heterocephalus glaber]|uniref:Chromodomain Y-like protein 2 n=1 Tax=Heterocephalus glaber TaxID=10181 RepID=A0AAX6SRW8_HETGA|nr:chromodomain Y-like protein 2 [Heterocephalus glaber]